MDDPRFYMAKVYRAVRNDEQLKNEFEQAINNCEGPDHAIAICEEYLALAQIGN